jgi:hypothetical protein
MPQTRVWPIVTAAFLVLLVVAGVAGWVVWRYTPTTPSAGAPEDRSVILVVALPDLEGVVTPRAIALYDVKGGVLTTSSIDPNTTATVPGTSARVLADAYLYGGGNLLASSYATLKGTPPPEWVVVDQGALGRLTGNRAVMIDLPAPVDVYDGTTLYSVPKGLNSISQADLPRLMDGVGFLAPDAQTRVREQVSDAVLRGLARSSASLQQGVRTSMQPVELEQWLEQVSGETSTGGTP